MKILSLVLLATTPLTAVSAQTPAAKTRFKGAARPAVEVPMSARPERNLRTSTAQSAAARVNKPPLHALPDFSVVNREGLTVSSKSLVQKSHWLLIYRRDHCLACDRLMNTIVAGSAAQAGMAPAFAVVVVGKDKAALDKVRASYENLANAVWVSDPLESSTTALKLHVAPVIYGMSGDSIVWTVSGSLSDSSLVERQASSWIMNPGKTPTLPANSTPNPNTGR
jgi:hypothetical protein